jgi:hypothetical protein
MSVKNRGRGQAYQAGVVGKRGEDGKFLALHNGQLTDFAKEFVENYVVNGGQPKAAYLMAGGDPEGARKGVPRLMATKKVREAIRRRQLEHVTGLANKAAGTIEELMLANDGTVPAAVRFQCARWCMETAGIGPQHAEKEQDIQQDKPLEEMSIRELEAFITAGGQAVREQREQEARTIEGQLSAPDSAPPDEDEDDNSLI